MCKNSFLTMKIKLRVSTVVNLNLDSRHIKFIFTPVGIFRRVQHVQFASYQTVLHTTTRLTKQDIGTYIYVLGTCVYLVNYVDLPPTAPIFT